eukprot:2530424-Ditylum_brightwellii.AAC.1
MVVTVITAYKACVVTKTTGITTYHQQFSLQQSKINATINPPKAFTCDLLQWMLTGKYKGEKFILGGDFNEPLISTSDMTKYCSHDELKLVDILGDLSYELFSTKKTGRHRIDYMLISPDLKKGACLDFDTKALFGDDH